MNFILLILDLSVWFFYLFNMIFFWIKKKENEKQIKATDFFFSFFAKNNFRFPHVAGIEFPQYDIFISLLNNIKNLSVTHTCYTLRKTDFLLKLV